MPSIFNTIVAALAAAPVALGHSWIEQIRNINDKGQYVGEYGYSRGMKAKTDPGYDGFSMSYEIPAAQGGAVFINATTMLCHPSQRKQVQSQDKYPRLKAPPGGFIALRYQENGHVTLPDNQKGKPKKGGTVFVYGTTQPKEDEKIADVLVWTKDGQGGDKRGILLATNNYDDGRCYETNPSQISTTRAKSFPNFAMGQVQDNAPGNYPLACETDVQLPKTADQGKPYTLYWVWQWNTASGGVDPVYPSGKDEYYSTCIDVDVTSANAALAATADQKFGLFPQQDAMSVAVSDFASRTALMTDAVKGNVGPFFSSKNGAPSATGGAPAPTGKAPSPPPAAPSPSKGKPSVIGGAPSATGSGPFVPAIPGPAPTGAPADVDIVTVTDTVIITVTAPANSKRAPTTTRRVRTSHKHKHRRRHS